MHDFSDDCPYNPKHGPLEIRDEKKRKQAKDALCELWDAMDLVWQLRRKSDPIMTAHLLAFEQLNQMLLGDDQVDGELYT